jgi:hypothetical protein
MALKEGKSETEPDDPDGSEVIAEQTAAVKAGTNKAYKRADVASPFSLTDAVQAEYDAAVKRSYQRVSTGKNNDDGKVPGSEG